MSTALHRAGCWIATSWAGAEEHLPSPARAEAQQEQDRTSRDHSRLGQGAKRRQISSKPDTEVLQDPYLGLCHLKLLFQ